MEFKKASQYLYKYFSENDDLLKLLFYYADDIDVDILNDEDSYPSIKNLGLEQKATTTIDSEFSESNDTEISQFKWEIVQDRIKSIPIIEDLDKHPKCRIVYKIGNTNPSSFSSHTIGNVEVKVDIFTHFIYQNDLRLEAIMDKISEILTNQKIHKNKQNNQDKLGIGNMQYAGGTPISNAPRNYVGYRMNFTSAHFKDR